MSHLDETGQVARTSFAKSSQYSTMKQRKLSKSTRCSADGVLPSYEKKGVGEGHV